jgi:hypothetical protein
VIEIKLRGIEKEKKSPATFIVKLEMSVGKKRSLCQQFAIKGGINN